MGPDMEEAARRLVTVLDSSVRPVFAVLGAGAAAVKARAEELAARAPSLNTWLVAAVRAATSTDPATAAGPAARGRRANRRAQGGVR